MKTKPNARWHVHGGDILTPSGVIPNGSLTIDDSQIQKISRGKSAAHRNELIFDAEGCWVIPGLIDLHVNGIGNCDLSQDFEKGLAAFSFEMARRGVTSFLPALISAPLPTLQKTLKSAAAAFEQDFPGARPLGIHLEGPFLNPLRRGVHPAKAIEPVSLAKLKRLLNAGEGRVKMMTLAPERDLGFEALRLLKKRGILAAMGHSDATYAEGIAAARKGYRYATHLFNAMRPWHHREPGLAGAVLDSPEVFAELICDGVHVAYPALEWVFKLKEKGRIVLASDELVGNGAKKLFAAQPIVRRGPRFIGTQNKILAGSGLSLIEGIRRWAQYSKRNWLEWIPLATINPSLALGTARETGSLQAGKMADFAVVSKNLNVKMTVVSGKIVYHRG